MNIQWKWAFIHALFVYACMMIGSVIAVSLLKLGALNPANLIISAESAFGYLGAVFIVSAITILGGAIGFAVSVFRTELYRGRHIFAVAILVLIAQIAITLFSTDFFNLQTFELSDFIAVFEIIPRISMPIVLSTLLGWVLGNLARKLFKRAKVSPAR